MSGLNISCLGLGSFRFHIILAKPFASQTNALGIWHDTSGIPVANPGLPASRSKLIPEKFPAMWLPVVFLRYVMARFLAVCTRSHPFGANNTTKGPPSR